MKLIWTVKLYTTGGVNKPYRVKIEGNPSRRSDVPWIFAEGKGQEPDSALSDAISNMAPSDAAQLVRFVGEK